ncbi:MAG: DNA-directed RNA polymerase subunit beta', partial [Alphaproteobacteria bacterium]|nr:DNA-directed RNA polymerase subunit beta' [Alphaproteobacteria bacterium]
MIKNSETLSVRGRNGAFVDFDYLSIKIASPEKILSWSHGEVKNSDTINYRTFKPEKDGLFCARIFGPVKDYECLCGKYKRMKYKGIQCEKCDVEVAPSRVRRERMGHIKLVYPALNTLYLRAVPSKLSILLDNKTKDVERVMYFDKYIVVDAGSTSLNKYQILSDSEYDSALSQFGYGTFVAEKGAKGILDALSSMDLEEEKKKIEAEITKTKREQKIADLKRRLCLVEDFITSGNRPEWMVFTVLPVLPPDLRPLVALDGGRMAVSDLNALYKDVINRNNRLGKLINMNAHETIIENECRMLQDAVSALLNNTNSNRAKVSKNSFGRPYKSISDFLKGKQGRLRQNLLGKRVDYSGRSVIVCGPELKLHQCGLPKEMALELFKPFVLSKLRLYGKATTIRQGNAMIMAKIPEVWEILEDVIREHPVLLNRAPTLHRLGIQAFEPKLIELKAIQVHPLVCRAFNADFDGDQMAVHVPLSIEAQLECRVLMMSSNNILSSANGAPM